MKIATKWVHQTEKREGLASSKGNQNKWRVDGVWYKADGLGYEALAEVLVSRLLEKSSINDFVQYEYEPLEWKETTFHGCRSWDFMTEEDDKIVSVERLFQTFEGESAAKAVLKYCETADRIKYVAEHVEQFTGICHFGEYLRKLLTVDALFLNEDRHFHNIAVIRKKDGSYRECPLFDQGASLFSDLKGDYPLQLDLQKCCEKIQAKPFSTDFDRQLDACETLYGGFRFRAWFTMKDVESVLMEFKGIYEEAELKRVQEVMRMQIRKYAYLFS